MAEDTNLNFARGLTINVTKQKKMKICSKWGVA